MLYVECKAVFTAILIVGQCGVLYGVSGSLELYVGYRAVYRAVWSVGQCGVQTWKK